MKITVTKKDINKAEKLSNSLEELFIAGENCPIALAVIRKFDIDYARITIREDDITIDYDAVGKNSVNYKLPKKARKFISDFDCGKNVKPIKFEARKIKD